MADRSIIPPELVSVDGADIVSRVAEFERYLSDVGVKIHPTSELRAILDDALAFTRVHGSQGLPAGHTYESYHASAQSAVVWAMTVLRTRGSQFEPQMTARLRHLAKGDPAMVRAVKSSRDHNLLFELFCACALARTLADVRLLDPPDVVCSFEGRHWGIACKVAYGSEEQVADAVQKGVRQVERSDVDGGMVVVDMTNVFPHQLLNPRLPEAPEFPATLHSGMDAYRLATGFVEVAATDIVRRVHLREGEVRKTQVIVFMGHTSCRVLGAPTTVPFFLGQPIHGRGLLEEAKQLCEVFKNGFGA